MESVIWGTALASMRLRCMVQLHTKTQVSPKILKALLALMQTVRRGVAYKGPALIVGDMNTDFEDLPHWPLLWPLAGAILAIRGCEMHGGGSPMSSLRTTWSLPRNSKEPEVFQTKTSECCNTQGARFQKAHAARDPD